jgi:ribonuclease HII
MSEGKRVSPGWKLVAEHIAAGRVVVGVDEVGRGSWAGPVTAGAVILPPRARLAGLADSKLLTAARREALDAVIRARALAVGLGWVSADELNDRGLSWAVKQSGLRALAELAAAFDVVVLDGSHNYLRDALADGQISETHVKADQKVAPVAAASVIAKVARDRYMIELAAQYPGYGFETHKGYGAKLHRQAIDELGMIDGIHRTSWKPFREEEPVND